MRVLLLGRLATPILPLAAALAVLCAVLGSCASVDFDYPRVPSRHLVDTQGTPLGREIAQLPAAAPGESGFHLLHDGIDALAARLLLARDAERSIDAQYYLISDDLAGCLFVDALLEAADRGVRVRLLVDDILTGGTDRGMRALDAHPNVELRIFNPFGHRRFRLFDGVTSFQRVNRRMHNKSFTVDNQATVIGGRNIGDHYFAAHEHVNFGDLDVFAVGPIVGDVSSMFDAYWNCDRSLPAPAVTGRAKDPELELRQFRERLAGRLEGVERTPYGEALASSFLDTALGDRDFLTWATYELVYDSPDKAHKGRAGEADSILAPLSQAIGEAERELLIISPYFVLRDSGQDSMRDMRGRGVEVRVITNSLAATNQAAVHAGYGPSRKPLLRMGVELYEVRPDRAVAGIERVGAESTRATLHAKAFVVDRERLFLGSFNFDPRSAFINTEMGVIIDSPELAAAAADGVAEVLAERTYRVVLEGDRRLRWIGLEDGGEVVLKKEPQTSWWRRFVVGFLKLLPIRGQL